MNHEPPTPSQALRRKRARLSADRIRARQEWVDALQQSLFAPGGLEQKLKTITEGVVEIFGADLCRIWAIAPGDLCERGCMHAAATVGPRLCRDRDRCLRLVASSGRYTHTDGKVHRRVPFRCYEIGRIASGHAHKFLINDVWNDPSVHDRDWARALGLVSFAGYQLRPPHGETLGVLALFSQRRISPEEDSQLDALSISAAQVLVAARADDACDAPTATEA